MEQSHDYRHDYTAANGFKGYCRVRVFEGGDDPEVRAVVILSDQDDGPSVTNNVEIIAAEVARDRGLDPEKTVFVEHYPRTASAIRSGLKEEFDVVNFVHHGPERGHTVPDLYQFGAPAWAPYSREAVQGLIGRELPDERLSEKQREEEAEPPSIRETRGRDMLPPKPWEPDPGDIVLERVPAFDKGLDTGDNLMHRIQTNVEWSVVHHSPDGFEWRYGGSGPADLALNILNMFVPPGEDGLPPVSCYEGQASRTAFALHQSFKEEYIARVPWWGGTIPGGMIRAWIEDHAARIE